MPQKDPEERRAYRKAYYKAHKAEHAAYSLVWYAKNRERRRAYARAVGRQRKLEVLEAYGGAVCLCCGDTHVEFLSIDHINGDGADHRRRVAGDRRFPLYQWLKKNSFPPGFRVLCMNCNVGKYRNGGVCPHKARCNDHSFMEVGSSDPKRMGPVRAMR